MKNLINEFKEFVFGANIIGLATGVIMGGAVNALINSLVNDIFMPIVGMLLGGKDFTALSINIGDAKVMYGAFIQSMINFLVMMLCVFAIIKAVNKLTRKAEKEAEEKKAHTTDDYLKEIRDLLKEENSNVQVKK